MSEWKETTLGDIINFRRGHDLPKTEMKEGKIPVVGSNGIIGFHDISTTKAPCVSIGRSGNVGTPLIINQDCWAHNTTLYIDDFKGNDPYYIFYHLGTLNLKDYGGGSAVPTLNRNHIHPIPTKIPPLPEQKAIAHILGTLDEKIELNRQLNQTLEAMAQALFKSWFVDFDPVIDNAIQAGNEIPEELQARAEKRRRLLAGHVIAPARRGVSKEAPIAIGGPKQSLNVIASEAKQSPDEVGMKQSLKPLLHTNPSLAAQFPASFVLNETLGKWIPEGWEDTDMTQCLDTISKTYKLKEIDEIIFLNTGDIEEGRFLHNHYSKTKGLPGQAKKSIQKGDILYSEIRPKNKRFAYVYFDAKDYVVSTKLMVLRPKNDVDTLFYYQILKSESTLDELQFLAESRSGTFPQITYDNLKAIRFVLPMQKEILDHFSKVLKYNFERSIENQKQIETLTQLRDTLLPELISGRVKVKEELINF